MKSILVFAGFLLLVFQYSCQTNSSATSAGSAGTDSMRYFTEQSYKGFESGDFSVFDRMVSSDVVDHGIGEKDVTGKNAVIDSLKQMNSQIKDLKFQILSQSADSNYSIAYVRMTGTSATDKSGFSKGTAIDSKSVDIVKWKDGKVAEHWTYLDPREMMAMMQPMPAPATANKMDSAKHK